jgi:hypothetical protein
MPEPALVTMASAGGEEEARGGDAMTMIHVSLMATTAMGQRQQ